MLLATVRAGKAALLGFLRAPCHLCNERKDARTACPPRARRWVWAASRVPLTMPEPLACCLLLCGLDFFHLRISGMFLTQMVLCIFQDTLCNLLLGAVQAALQAGASLLVHLVRLAWEWLAVS